VANQNTELWYDIKQMNLYVVGFREVKHFTNLMKAINSQFLESQHVDEILRKPHQGVA
jgi:hypothetical protein